MASRRENVPNVTPARQKASCPSTSVEFRRQAVEFQTAGDQLRKCVSDSSSDRRLRWDRPFKLTNSRLRLSQRYPRPARDLQIPIGRARLDRASTRQGAPPRGRRSKPFATAGERAPCLNVRFRGAATISRTARAYSQKVADFLDKNMLLDKELKRAMRFYRIGKRSRSGAAHTNDVKRAEAPWSRCGRCQLCAGPAVQRRCPES